MIFAGQMKEHREVVFDRLDGKPVLAGASPKLPVKYPLNTSKAIIRFLLESD